MDLVCTIICPTKVFQPLYPWALFDFNVDM